jgi:hypothetical protein
LEIFSSQIVPLSVMMVYNIGRYFDNYRNFNFREWLMNLWAIIKDLSDYQDQCHLIVLMYESLIASLKKNDDDSIHCGRNLEKSTGRLGERLKKYKARVAGKNKLVDYFSKIPQDYFWLTMGMIPVVTAFLRRDAKKAQSKALKTEEDLIEAKKAIIIIRDHLRKHIQVGNSLLALSIVVKTFCLVFCAVLWIRILV